MIAAIPFFELRVMHLDIFGYDLPIDPWGTLVIVSFVVGMEVARSRGIKQGLDVKDIVDGSLFIVLMGFVIGHFFTVIAYHPERLIDEPVMSLLRIWDGFSSMGGFIGAIVGSVLFFKVIRKRSYFQHADAIAYGFPFGFFFGRLACGVVHDHIGRLTDSPFGMRFPAGHFAEGVRFEMGLAEAAYVACIALLFWFLGRVPRKPGFFLGLLPVVYSPVRIWLDSMRNTDLKYQDVRYWGFTPAQYGAVVLLFLGLGVLYATQRKVPEQENLVEPTRGV